MKTLRIALFGNINNSPLRIAEGLKALGHTAHLFVNRKEPLHRPESLYPAWKEAYPPWIHDASDVTDHAIAYNQDVVRYWIDKLNDNFDIVILNDYGPSLASQIKPPHVVVLTGSDVSYYSDFDTLDKRSGGWNPSFKRSPNGRTELFNWANLIARQRDGISSAALVIHPFRGLVPENDRILDNLAVSDEIRAELWMPPTDQVAFFPAPRNQPFRILCPSRVNIAMDAHTIHTIQDVKRTDILIRGYADYCQQGGKAELHLFKKGKDIDLAQELMRALDIFDRVVWHDEIPIWQLREQMRDFDLICDQFSATSSGLVTWDAWAIGRPVMANFCRGSFPGRFHEEPPGFEASNPEEVSAHLTAFERRPEMLEEMGIQSRLYAERCSNIEEIVKRLVESAS